MEQLLLAEKQYCYYPYTTEAEFEKVIIQNAKFIFGEKAIYIDIKKRIGDSIITIPDGYLIDFSFKKEPRLYIIENELSIHNPYKHIGAQILKFAISYKATGRKIKNFLLNHLVSNPELLVEVEENLKEGGYRNIDDILENIIFEKPVSAIVIIDKATVELENVLGQLTIDTDIIEFQTFKFNEESIHKFIPFNAEIREVTNNKISSLMPDELDTIVVPAREEGFEQEFIGNKRWFAIRINASMIDKLKYIAAYQVAPISAITHYAEIAAIEKWKDTNKYILYLKDEPNKIVPIKLDANKKGLAPQAPRYTSIIKIQQAKKLSQIFG